MHAPSARVHPLRPVGAPGGNSRPRNILTFAAKAIWHTRTICTNLDTMLKLFARINFVTATAGTELDAGFKKGSFLLEGDLSGAAPQVAEKRCFAQGWEGHDFSRAVKSSWVNGALAPEVCFPSAKR